MRILETVLARRRLVLMLTMALFLMGWLSWNTMIRQEDPSMPEYWGQILVAFPGASATQVENLVLKPIEDNLAEVAEIGWTEAEAYDEMLTMFIELEQDVSDTDDAWDEVRAALDRAHREFPMGAQAPALNDEAGSQLESVVLAITGSGDPLQLLEAARLVKRELLEVDDVSLVNLIGEPREQIRIEMSRAAITSLAMTPASLAGQLRQRNRIVAGGSLVLGETTLRLRPLANFSSIHEIEQTPIVVGDGSAVPLSELATVRYAPEEPKASMMRFDSQMAVGVGVVAEKQTNLVSYGNAVRRAVDRLRAEIAPLEIHEVAFQPDRVRARLGELGNSLLLGILIVAGVVVAFMGLRLGLLVAAVVPVVAMSSLAIYAFSGGVLHQISIAALVLALGMLVDNAIVVAENVQARIDEGEQGRRAATQAVRELALPLAAATLTTLAAFVPMLLSTGPTADFTRAIPILIMLTLSVSYLFAIVVTPILAQTFLVGGKTRSRWTAGLARRVSWISTQRPWTVIVLAIGLVALSLVSSQFVKRQFFPAADRNQVLVDVKLSEGTHLSGTLAAVRALEAELVGRQDVSLVSSFIGRSAPKFYYNLARIPWSPHFAQVLIETNSVSEVAGIIGVVREFAETDLIGVEVIARRLEQGPQVDAPVEIRLFGQSLDELRAAAEMIIPEVRSVSGTRDVRHDLSPGAPTLEFMVADAQAARFAVTRADIAESVYGHTRGFPIGELNDRQDPVPVVVRSPAGETTAPEDLVTLDVTTARGGMVPLGQVAEVSAVWQPAVIKHRNRHRVVTVSSQLVNGATFSDVLTRLEPRLRSLALPTGIEYEFGGDAEGSGEANASMMRAMPIGVLLLLGVLLAEFNSFRKLAIVLATVPLAAAGVIPGLILNSQPFGFMSTLGVIALVGIVVNNAIVLLELVESLRRRGASVSDALREATSHRIRPILLTTATTVAGLLPLALSKSTLWPPLASAMISGLLASTVLTLIVVPALYQVLFGERARKPAWRPRFARGVAMFLIGAASQLALGADELTLRQSMEAALNRPAALASLERARGSREDARATRRAGLLPSAEIRFSASDRNRDLEIETPVGAFSMGENRSNAIAIQVDQPLFNAARHVYAPRAADARARADHAAAARRRQLLAAEAGYAHLTVYELEARKRSTEAFIESLEARRKDLQEMVDNGRALKADVLKVLLELEQAELDLVEIESARDVALANYARTVGRHDPVRPGEPEDYSRKAIPEYQIVRDRAVMDRRDAAVLRHGTRALESDVSAVKAEAIPSVGARLQWSWNDGSPYSANSWAEAAVMMRWKVFSSAARGPRARSLDAQRRALCLEESELANRIGVEIRAALAAIETAKHSVEVGRRAIEYATENLRVERERFLSGRSTTKDLLVAEAELRSRTTQADLVRIEVVKAWIDLWVARGSTDVGLLDRE